MKTIRIILAIAVISQGCAAQQKVKKKDQKVDAEMQALEVELMNELSQLRAAKTDAEKKMLNDAFTDLVEEAIVKKAAFAYAFDSLKTVGTITSPDQKFRLFNWNVESEDGTYQYYCYVIRNSASRNKNTFIKLNDRSDQMRNPEQLDLDNRNWFGALYYKIIPIERKGKTMYTMLAWDGNTRLTTKKFVDVMYFQGNKKVKFGYPLFKTPNDGVQKRYFLEFASGQYVSMKHELKKKEDYIIYAHLSPKAPQLEGIKEHYVTDGTYDAFHFNEELGTWVLVQDVDQRNPKEKAKRPYNDPEDPDNPNRQ